MHMCNEPPLIPETIGPGDSFLSSFRGEQLKLNARKSPSYNTKPISTWTTDDILDWLLAESEKLGVDCTQLRAENFTRLTGADLVELTESEFKQKVPFLGQSLCDSIRLMSIADNRRSHPNRPLYNNTKPVNTWTTDDILDWLSAESKKVGVDCTQLRSENFTRLTGADLVELTESEFKQKVPSLGQSLCDSVQLMSVADDRSHHPSQYERKHDSSLHLKPINSWSTDDVFEWLFELSEKLGVDCTQFRGEAFSQTTGVDLLNMTEEEFQQRAPKWGRSLYASIHLSNDSHLQENCSSDGALQYGDPSSVVAPKKKKLSPSQVVIKKRGRPKNPNKQNKKKAGSLGRPYEFLLSLLKDPKTCPSIIRWENYETGTFRFTDSGKVAKLWAKRNDNKNMNFSGFSRAMRYHYTKGYLKSEDPRSVYSFGPSFKSWKVEDPNCVEAS